MSSDFKEVLRERIDVLVRNRVASIEAAVVAAREEIDQVVGRLHETATASPLTGADGATLDQLSAEIAAQIGTAAAESSRLSGDLALLRDSVVDIDTQQTQADVLNALVVAIAGAVVAAQRLTRPIEELTEAANRISLGELDVPIVVSTGDEIGTLGESLDRMRISLKQAIERLRKR